MLFSLSLSMLQALCDDNAITIIRESLTIPVSRHKCLASTQLVSDSVSAAPQVKSDAGWSDNLVIYIGNTCNHSSVPCN